MNKIKFTPNKSAKFSYPIGGYIAKNKKAINDLKRVMKQTIGTKNHVTFWCRGSSGAIIAAMVSIGFPKSIINHVKKDGEFSHSEGDYNLQLDTINVIIDDFSNTGKTLNAIYEGMHKITVDYVCVIGRITVPHLSFTPNNIISRYAYLDKQENNKIDNPHIITKYATSNNYKVVKDETKIIHKNFLNKDYLINICNNPNIDF